MPSKQFNLNYINVNRTIVQQLLSKVLLNETENVDYLSPMQSFILHRTG